MTSPGITPTPTFPQGTPLWTPPWLSVVSLPLGQWGGTALGATPCAAPRLPTSAANQAARSSVRVCVNRCDACLASAHACPGAPRPFGRRAQAPGGLLP